MVSIPQHQLVLFQSNDPMPWLIVNKPAGISVHNEPGHDLISIVAKKTNIENLIPVNRLDLETSGIVVLASTPETVAKINIALEKSDKYYLCLCKGILKSKDSWQIWNNPLSKGAEGFRNPQGKPKDRVEAITQWKVLGEDINKTLLLVKLITGRKHQIRRHCVLAGAPVWNENRYTKFNKNVNDFGLHSYRLQFTLDSNNYDFTCSPPESFRNYLGNIELDETSLEKEF